LRPQRRASQTSPAAGRARRAALLSVASAPPQAACREAEDADADIVEADPEVRAALVRAGRNLEALDAAARNEATAAAVEGVRALLDDLRSKPELVKRAPRLQELLRRTRARLARLEGVLQPIADADVKEALRTTTYASRASNYIIDFGVFRLSV